MSTVTVTESAIGRTRRGVSLIVAVPNMQNPWPPPCRDARPAVTADGELHWSTRSPLGLTDFIFGNEPDS